MLLYAPNDSPNAFFSTVAYLNVGRIFDDCQLQHVVRKANAIGVPFFSICRNGGQNKIVVLCVRVFARMHAQSKLLFHSFNASIIPRTTGHSKNVREPLKQFTTTKQSSRLSWVSKLYPSYLGAWSIALTQSSTTATLMTVNCASNQGRRWRLAPAFAFEWRRVLTSHWFPRTTTTTMMMIYASLSLWKAAGSNQVHAQAWGCANLNAPWGRSSSTNPRESTLAPPIGCPWNTSIFHIVPNCFTHHSFTMNFK